MTKPDVGVGPRPRVVEAHTSRHMDAHRPLLMEVYKPAYLCVCVCVYVCVKLPPLAVCQIPICRAAPLCPERAPRYGPVASAACAVERGEEDGWDGEENTEDS